MGAMHLVIFLSDMFTKTGKWPLNKHNSILTLVIWKGILFRTELERTHTLSKEAKTDA